VCIALVKKSTANQRKEHTGRPIVEKYARVTDGQTDRRAIAYAICCREVTRKPS